MKKKGLWLLAAFGLLAVSCMKEPAQEPEAQMTDMPSITAVTLAESPATRVSVGPAVDGKRPIVWNTGDALSVFFKNSMNVKYVLKGEGGEPEGVFAYASGLSFGYEFPQVYGAYPYDEKVKLEDGCLWVTIPAEQSYTEKTFDPKANAMVGVSDPGKEMPFRNVGGYLVLQFYGEDAEVKEVKVTGAMAEQIAGTVLMGVEEDEIPWLVDWGDGASDEVKLVAETPVKVGATAEEATEFWLVLMPVTFMDGLTVTVTDADGNLLLSQTKDSAVEIKRSEVYRLDPLCLSHSNGAFAASVTWTYADDADVDHNLFYGSEGTTRYSREALPLGVDASIVTKYGEEIAAATPEGVTVTVADPETGDTVPADDVTVSNITLKDGDLVADVEGFLWDKVYGVSVEYALSGSELTLDGSLTTVDRKREPVTLDLVAEYTFDINKLDSETGFGYIEKEPVKDSWYKWESEPLTDAIYAAYLNGGVITKDDFANADEFFKEEVEDEVRAAPSSGSAKEFVTVSRETACPSTTSSGKADPDDPYRIVGNDLDRRITTYIGQEVIIPIRLSYRVPKYDFLHLMYYTFNPEKEVEGFITKYDFEENDGSVLWWSQVYPSYLIEPADESKSEDEIQQGISYRHALANFDISYINLAELAFNVVDEQDSILEAAQMEDLGLSAKFFYADETLADKSLPTEDQFVPVFKTYKSLWVDNTVLYYRTNEKKFIPVKGSLTIQSGGCDFPIPTRFDTPKASFLHPDVMLDYSSYAVVRWIPFKEPVAKGSTIVLDENKIYRVPLFKGMELKDNRPQGVSYYVIEDGEWVKGNVNELDPWSGAPTDGNGYREGVLSKDAYRLSLTVNYDSFFDNVPKELTRLLSLQFSADGETFVAKQNEGGTLTPYVVYDYTSEVQFQGTITIPVVVYIESPWQEKLTFEYDVTIKGYNAP